MRNTHGGPGRGQGMTTTNPRNKHLHIRVTAEEASTIKDRVNYSEFVRARALIPGDVYECINCSLGPCTLVFPSEGIETYYLVCPMGGYANFKSAG